MKDSFKDMAQRIVNAEENFIESLMRIASCTKQEAENVMFYYLKHKIAKRDIQVSRINVKHGAFLEADVIRRAIKEAA